MLPLLVMRSQLSYPDTYRSVRLTTSIPMVVETFGTWGRRAEPVLKFIARAAAFNKKNSEDNSESFLRAALNVTLMRHNADTLIRHRDRFSPQVDGPVPET